MQRLSHKNKQNPEYMKENLNQSVQYSSEASIQNVQYPNLQCEQEIVVKQQRKLSFKNIEKKQSFE